MAVAQFVRFVLLIMLVSPWGLSWGQSSATASPSDHRDYLVEVVRIPMRDGASLAGTLYRSASATRSPVVLSITPYGRHIMHPVAAAYAKLGLAFLAVDTRGRGDSEGIEAVFHADVQDTVDAIAWASEQSFGDGQVAMRGNSYGGFNQWMAAAKGAPALKTITPAAAVYPGLDFPTLHNVGYPYAAIWTGFTKGRMANFPLFGDREFWRQSFTEVLARGIPFRDIDEFVGLQRDLFDEWADHPHVDDYWRAVNPTDAEMASLDIPVLSVTGLFDGAQLGALGYYSQHMANANEKARGAHYLVIGPYDHGGVTVPKATVGGVEIPNAGGVNPIVLYGEWLAWQLLGAPKPAFLRDRVMYYVVGANEWRSAPSLEALPVEDVTFFLAGDRPTSVPSAGLLSHARPEATQIRYRYDPRDTSKAPLGVWFDGDYLLHDADVLALDRDGFVFESAPFDKPMEIIGQPEFDAHIGIDTPDTDFRLRLYEIKPNGKSVQLSYSLARARYREGPDRSILVDSPDLNPYSFDGFSFTAFRLEAGSRLRLVVDAPNSIYLQRNYNAAKPVALQTPDDARVSTVSMQLGGADAAVLTVPMREVQ